MSSTLLSALFATIASAGAIVTIEGKRVEGDLKKTPEGWQVTSADGTITSVPGNRVKTIELSSTGGVGAGERLASLRRSVEALDDIPKIIERYKRFIEQTRDAGTLADANKDLAAWQDRLNKSLVKVGKEWISVEERKKRVVEALGRVNEAHDLIKAGRFKDADGVLSQIVAADPGNLSALYLEGVIAMKQDKLIDAKKLFAQVQQSLGDHAPTLMNLSIINARQRQWPAAASLAEQSLGASPVTQILVDNAAELLNAMPDDVRKSAQGQRLQKRFAEQDELLQRRMADKQQFRWGATWVNRDQHDKLVEAEKDVKKRLDELQGDFDLTQNRITRIDSQIEENNRMMRDIESSSYTRLADGRYIQIPYPATYYDIERDNTKLKSERTEMVKRLDALRDAAKRAQADVPVPKFSGTLHPVGEDGVPIVIPAGVQIDPPVDTPATKPEAPATQPDKPMIIKIGPADEPG